MKYHLFLAIQYLFLHDTAKYNLSALGIILISFYFTLQRYNKFCTYTNIRAFFLRKKRYIAICAYRVTIGSLLTNSYSGRTNVGTPVPFSQKNSAFAMPRTMRPYFRRGPHLNGGGGRRYNKFCTYTNIRRFFFEKKVIRVRFPNNTCILNFPGW